MGAKSIDLSVVKGQTLTRKIYTLLLSFHYFNRTVALLYVILAYDMQ